MTQRDEHPDTPSPDPAEERPPKGTPARKEAEERIDDALDMTFPASDPPAWPSRGSRRPDSE